MFFSSTTWLLGIFVIDYAVWFDGMTYAKPNNQDPEFCQYIEVEKCPETFINSQCINLCTPKTGLSHISDPEFCQYFEVEKCHITYIKTQCVNLCTPKTDPEFCQYLEIEKCQITSIKTQCVNLCTPNTDPTMPSLLERERREEEEDQLLEEEGDETVTPSPSTPKCKYRKEFGKEHTMALKRNKDCNFFRKGVTKNEQKLILKTHNDFRNKVASGNETRGNPGPQPPASNMREMVWNDQLAEVAQAWAEQCGKAHDKQINRRICNRSYRVGQNVFNNLGHIDRSLWEKAVTAWYDEVEHMPNTDVDSKQKPPSGMIGHYTQLVWAKTYEVGCGAIYYKKERKGVSYDNCKKYVCNYGPAGNYKKAAVYLTGEPGSECENGKSTEYPNLCA